MLDGWRGISITLVLLGHLFPLGPKSWNMNVAANAVGMSIFFILSGFLITSLLLRDARVGAFLIRRLMRILPIAWLAMLLVLIGWRVSGPVFLRHLLFVANWDPVALIAPTMHLWSLCIEVQFYVGIALLVLFLGRRGLWTLPVIALLTSILRLLFHRTDPVIYAYFRFDEILAGCCLALLYRERLGLASRVLSRLSPWPLFALLLFVCHDGGPWAIVLKPYIAMLMIGSSMFMARSSRLVQVLEGRTLGYLAEVSYALYVIHGCLMATWLSSGDKLVKYLKRPLFLAATFALAHLSTFQFEHRCTELGRRWAGRGGSG